MGSWNETCMVISRLRIPSGKGSQDENFDIHENLIKTIDKYIMKTKRDHD